MTARVGVDVGGTFTDIVIALGEDLLVWKVPSTPDQSEGFAAGVGEALTRAGAPPVEAIAHGTTVATNAVLERSGARLALVTTDGFRDLLTIGRQQRPHLYDLTATRPEPLVGRDGCVTVRGRIAPDGSELEPLPAQAIEAAVEAVRAHGAEAVAVCLLFGFANPSHERAVADAIRSALPAVRVSVAHEVLPEFREYERASTTALDAYVGPVIERYLERIAERVEHLGAPVTVMRSGGGTMSARAPEPVHTLLSGPAAGVRGATLVARTAGVDDVVTFDMGGTSTDVCLVEDGEPAVATEGTIGGLPFRTPSLAVHTVGAGGGSILWVDEAGALRVGPRSAGAFPGPACYGRGGTEAAITDAHLVLGHLDPVRFLGGRMRLDEGAARTAVGTVAERLGASPDEVARAGLAAARANMAAAVRVVTVQRGRDPRAFSLVAFGGAGPMHATALADELGIAVVLIPPASGVLSALGLLSAPPTADASRTSPMTGPSPEEVAGILAEVEARAVDGLSAQGSEPAALSRAVDCRYRGQAHEVTVPADDVAAIPERFTAEHRARFGWDAPGEPVELVTFRARAEGHRPPLELPSLPAGTGAPRQGRRRIAVADGWADAASFFRGALGAGDRIDGPAVVDGEESTTVIDPGWCAEVDPYGTLVMRRC